MDDNIIKSLKSNLADLTYILFVIRKEFEQIIETSDDEKTNENLRKTTSALQESNNNVIRLYHEINKNEDRIKNEWYNDDTTLKKLKKEVDNLKKSIDALIDGNKNLLK